MPRIRLIPARAGRTRAGGCVLTRHAAHPRSRGADCAVDGWRAVSAGSSPLARGGRIDHVEPEPDVRLIPARAGRTRPRSSAPPAKRAHPRSRGADIKIRLVPTAAMGSSPLARGGRRDVVRATAQDGLIPARAGRTLCACSSTGATRAHPARAGRTFPSLDHFAMREAHPRSRGADHRAHRPLTVDDGSSPLARGGLRTHRRGFCYSGLIPARAGRTVRVRLLDGGDGAHPRSRGADRVAPCHWWWGSGSSPLARGGRGLTCIGTQTVRLIPARAGRTPSRSCTIAARWAHPRSRGADQTTDTEGEQ